MTISVKSAPGKLANGLACAAALAALMLLAPGVSAQGAPAKTAAAAAAPAAPPANPVIAIVDVDRIMQQSTAAQSMRAQGEKYEKALVDQENQIRASLEAQEKDLEQQRGKLAQDAFGQKQQAFNNNVAEQQRQALLRQQAFQRSANTALSTVQKAILEATQEVSEAKGANFVFTRSLAMFYDQRSDITDEVVAIMNKKTPKVDFPVPKVDASAAGSPPQLTAGGPSGGVASLPGAGPSQGGQGGLNLALPR